jgi:protein O-mannosyl-transferase
MAGAVARPGMVALLLASITVAVYWPVTGYDFINYDDPDYVTLNSQVLAGLTLDGVVWSFCTGHGSNWHPITWLSHMLDVTVCGTEAGPMHLANLLLHAANTVLVFVTLRRLTGAHWPSAVVAALFAWHPLHVESVAWISERKDLLSTLFGLLTLLAYGNYAAKSAAKSQKRKLDYALALGFFALGLMSKPMLVTLPFVMLLLDWWPLGRFEPSAHAGDTLTVGGTRSRRYFELASLPRLVLEKAPFFLLSGISSIVTLQVQKAGGTVQTFTDLPLVVRMENSLVAYARYLKKAVWPAHLAIPYPPPPHWPWRMVFVAALLVFGLSLLALSLRRKHPYVTTGWFWFLGMLVPVIGVIQVGDQSLADRYTYLPLTGVFIILAWGGAETLARWRRVTPLVIAAAVMVLAVCLSLTRNQVEYWRNSETLFRRALAVTEHNGIAHEKLGESLAEKGQVDEAIRQLQEAIRLLPDFAQAHNNLGYHLAVAGQMTEAVRQFQEAIRLKPNYPQAHNNLGAALLELGQIDEAIRHFQEALRLKPDYSQASDNLARALGRKNPSAGR